MRYNLPPHVPALGEEGAIDRGALSPSLIPYSQVNLSCHASSLSIKIKINVMLIKHFPGKISFQRKII